MVLSPAWKVLRFGSEIFFCFQPWSAFPLSLIFHPSSLRGTSSIHTPSPHQRIRSSGCQWRWIFDFDLSMIHVGQAAQTDGHLPCQLETKPHRRFASPFAGCGPRLPSAKTRSVTAQSHRSWTTTGRSTNDLQRSTYGHQSGSQLCSCAATLFSLFSWTFYCCC